MKNTRVINGHPYPKSYCRALTEAYIEGYSKSNSSGKLEVIHVVELEFDLNLKYEYRKHTELEPHLIRAQ